MKLEHKTLTPKQQRFVEEYLIDLNATQAAKRAGYSEKTAFRIGTENLHKPAIQVAIQEALQKRSDRTEITADSVLRELAVLAFSDMAHYVQFNEAGNILLDFSQMPAGASRAIAEVVQDEYVDGKGEEARTVKRTRFKLHGKQPALDSLAKHLGMYIERHAVEIVAINAPPAAATYEEWLEQNRQMEEATGTGLHSVPAEHAEFTDIPESDSNGHPGSEEA